MCTSVCCDGRCSEVCEVSYDVLPPWTETDIKDITSSPSSYQPPRRETGEKLNVLSPAIQGTHRVYIDPNLINLLFVGSVKLINYVIKITTNTLLLHQNIFFQAHHIYTIISLIWVFSMTESTPLWHRNIIKAVPILHRYDTKKLKYKSTNITPLWHRNITGKITRITPW